jgi:hypothetical protein
MEKLSNGTLIVQGADFCVTTLPNGDEVHAHPNDESLVMARKLGYGDDVAALTRDHDALHSRLMDWLGAPYSYSLMRAAGYEKTDWGTAILEEKAVLAVQELMNALKNNS